VDIGRMPRTRRESTPRDEPVKEWAEAMAREKDPYLRLVWLMIAQGGIRPSHATGFRWSDVRYDLSGHPEAIVASGSSGEFKTFSPIAMRLPTDVASTLEDWRRQHPGQHPDAWILPWRSLKGRIDPDRRMDSDLIRRHWAALRRKYGLPALRPKDLRHWVSTACRKAGLSKAATAYLQGHDAAEGGAMRDWYDNPRVEEILEEQHERLPRGPLGLLVPVEVEISADRPPEALALLDAYLDGTVGTMEFATQMEKIRLKAIAGPVM
jgi:integrase